MALPRDSSMNHVIYLHTPLSRESHTLMGRQVLVEVSYNSVHYRMRLCVNHPSMVHVPAPTWRSSHNTSAT